MIIKIDRQNGQFEYYECDIFQFGYNDIPSHPDAPSASVPHYTGMLLTGEECGRPIAFNVAYVMENGKTVDVIRPVNS